MVVVLVVEDDVDIRQDIREVLDLEGYEVLLADDGAGALPLLQTRQVDIILSDVLMPKMTRYELLAEVRAMEQYQSTHSYL